MPKVESNDWKHLQFHVFYNVFVGPNTFYKSIKTCFYVFFYLQMNVFNVYDISSVICLFQLPQVVQN